MNYPKVIFMCLAFIFIQSAIKAQTDFNNLTKFDQNGYRVLPSNEFKDISGIQQPEIPKNLIDAYAIAGDKFNNSEKQRLGLEIDKYLLNTSSRLINQVEYEVIYEENSGEFDWYNNDIELYNNDVGNASFKTMDLKYAEDGRMYFACIRRNVIGNNGSLRIYSSGNGGVTWPASITWNYPSLYIQSISMLVERRDDNNDDSTRIFIYLVGSTNSNFDNASIYLFSCRRNATGVYSLEILSPAAGNRFTHVSACSDGAFFESGTAMHVVAREETNAGSVLGLRHLRSLNWGLTHTSGTLANANNDMYPSAAFSIQSGIDSIYIAVERRVANDEYEIRMISTSEAPINTYNTRMITDAASGTVYEKPSLSIQQRNYQQPQNILITCSVNRRAVYHYSTNGGASWTLNSVLGLSTQVIDFTSCASDSLTTGNGYFMAAFVDSDGDSITVRRGVLGSLGTYNHKRNSFQSTGVISPVCAIYRDGSNKYSAFAYAGTGPSSIYYNMESLVTGIQSTGGIIPNKFSLSQNYPNPFNPVTNIEFAIPLSSSVKLVIYDIRGRIVETLVNAELSAGTYKADWNASNYSTGVYFYMLESEGFSETKKMMIVK